MSCFIYTHTYIDSYTGVYTHVSVHMKHASWRFLTPNVDADSDARPGAYLGSTETQHASHRIFWKSQQLRQKSFELRDRKSLWDPTLASKLLDSRTYTHTLTHRKVLERANTAQNAVQNSTASCRTPSGSTSPLRPLFCDPHASRLAALASVFSLPYVELFHVFMCDATNAWCALWDCIWWKLKEPYKRDYTLQKRPIVWTYVGMLRIVGLYMVVSIWGGHD